MVDKDFEKYMEKKRKCKGYRFYNNADIFKYSTRIEHNDIVRVFAFLNAKDAKWAYLEFHKIFHKEGYQKAMSWILSYNEKYKKDYAKKCLDNLGCEWRYIDNYNEMYAVTEYGDIYSLSKKLKLHLTNNYYRVGINFNHCRKEYFAHRLVASAFLERPNKEDLVVDHIDRNKLNNHYSNLRWVTQRQNKMNSDNMDNAYGVIKNGNSYSAKVQCLGQVIYRSFSNEKDARNFYIEHRKKINSLSEDEATIYCKSLKLKSKKEKYKLYKGYSKSGKKYASRIKHNGKIIHLGSFKTDREARQAYLDAVEKYHGIKIEE